MSSEPELTMPEHRVFPMDLDLDEIAKRDEAALPLLASIVDELTASGAEPDADVMLMLKAVTDRHELLTELYAAKRDRDSARNTVLTVAQLVPRWANLASAEVGADEFKRGLRAASATLAEVLARQMLRD
jgi:hypothetical protein